MTSRRGRGPDRDALPWPSRAAVILCADDFGMADGVSRAIEELALARRLSATSAIVTLPCWTDHAPRLVALRPYLAMGLHINLTLGPPLGRSPGLAPGGELASHGALVRKCLIGRIHADEIADEITRQLVRFEETTGFPPDHIDGHQHVHALPSVRDALMKVLVARFPPGRTRPLVRDPADRIGPILRRRRSAMKAQAIAMLSLGFGRRVRAAGFPTNSGFAGVSAFDLDVPYLDELSRAFVARGRRHLVMCHPGYPDEALAELDPVVERRHQELDALFAAPRLDEAIWHVSARPDRVPVEWERALPV
jgi:predicted glycoside hydrolase/deacetylase ChbG (UPF0249 family)